MISLPQVTNPGEKCCGEDIYKDGPKKYATAWCRTFGGDPIITADRWVLLYRWQCKVKEFHHGYFYTTTDEEVQPPAQD